MAAFWFNYGNCGINPWINHNFPHRLAGRAAYLQGKLAAAESAYREAISRNDESIPALEGLALVKVGSSSFQDAAYIYSDLVSQIESLAKT